MRFKNTDTSFGFPAKLFHWAIALIILGLLPVGFYMADMDFSPLKLQVYGWHKSFGLLVLALAVLRLIWRFINKPPGELATHQPWERTLSKGVHVFLYILIFAMPFSGWFMSSAGDFPVGFFGMFEMPDISAKDEGLFKLSLGAHTVMAYAIIALVGLHVAGAFKHHFIDRDITLQRMTRTGLGFRGGVFLVLMVGILLAAPVVFVGFEYMESQGEDAGKAPQSTVQQGENDHMDVEQSSHQGGQNPAVQKIWLINKDASSIRFEATQYGQVFAGEFEVFDGVIIYDQRAPERSHADITIDISSIKTGSEDRDQQALSEDWFAADTYQQARFISDDFVALDTNRHIVKGDLTIRGIKLPVELPFTLEIIDAESGEQYAVMKSEITLNRLDFGIGQGQWQSPETIGDKVKVMIHIDAMHGTRRDKS